MNKLEQLAANNHNNYDEYLHRMDKSMAFSTKGFIPLIAEKYHTILDVGCADGALIKIIQGLNPEVEAIGIDINSNAVQKARSNGVAAYHLPLNEAYSLGVKFDCIIFSSVLHEFSSYDSLAPYSAAPIKTALKIASHLLTDNGIIIVRDGLGVENTCLVRVEFQNPKDSEWLIRFVGEFRGMSTALSITNTPNVYKVPYALAQEFLATWTWGAESWAREINERFCILTKAAWKRVFLEANLQPISFTTSKEEYPKYLNNKVKLYNEENKEVFPDMTFLAVLKKL